MALWFCDDGVKLTFTIQRIPDLLNEVHRFIENRNCKFVLTRSSAKKVRKKGVTLLAERQSPGTCIR